MNTSGEAAEQIVRMSLEGFEVAARITGAGAKTLRSSCIPFSKKKRKPKARQDSPTCCALERN